MSTTTITNDRGRNFTVRIVWRGDAYGLDGCRTHDEDRPLVEFYDATYAGDKRFDAEGQFIGRYDAETLLERDGNYGLDLHGGVDVWKVDADAMHTVYEFIEDALAWQVDIA